MGSAEIVHPGASWKGPAESGPMPADGMPDHCGKFFENKIGAL